VATERARTRCRERLEALAGSGAGLDTLRLEAIALLRAAIGFGRWTIMLVDPGSLVLHDGVCDTGLLAELAWLNVHDAGLRDVNNITMLARSRDPVGLLSAATGGDLARCYRWRRIYAPAGFGDELRAAAVDQRGCWADVHLFRDSDDRPFSAADAQLLRDTSATLARAVRRAMVTPRPGTHRPAPAETGIVILDDDLRPRSWTASAQAWFRALQPDASHTPDGIPVGVWSAVGRLRSLERGEVAGLAPRVMARGADGQWAVTEAARLHGDDSSVVVSLRAARAEEVLGVVSRCHGLTPRERELVALLIDGQDTHAIARRLSITAYTVQDHLKSVFTKVGVNSRRDLVAGVVSQTRACTAATPGSTTC
jgi:DNA-binding CsgD family transcriptional regulator